ncbi:MAG: hypothetical protein QF827_02185 [Alphaproteobacteria bacterium]|jgi:hypothetical protein|nr:hypothetical protein [Alphaproteobacteria bacterium]
MAAGERERSFAPMVVALALAGGLGGAYVFNAPFEPQRPKGEDLSVFYPTDKIPARQWQDPFTAISHYYDGDRPGDAMLTEVDVGPSIPADTDELIVMPVMVYGGSYAENIEDRRRRRYAVLSALHYAGYSPEESEHLRCFAFRWADTKVLPCGTIDAARRTGEPANIMIPFETLRGGDDPPSLFCGLTNTGSATDP